MRTPIILSVVLALGVMVGGSIPGLSLEAPGHSAWYASRSAGLVSYLLLWLGLAGGLVMSSAWFDGLVLRPRLLAIHQTAGIAGVAFGALHALVLIPDGWTDFTLVGVLVPFASSTDRAALGVGTAALYLSAIVSFSFWFRSRIGAKAWKRVHYAGFVAYLAALWHGMTVGTDTGEPWALVLYASTGITIVFAVTVRLTYRKPARRRAVVQKGAQPVPGH